MAVEDQLGIVNARSTIIAMRVMIDHKMVKNSKPQSATKRLSPEPSAMVIERWLAELRKANGLGLEKNHYLLCSMILYRGQIPSAETVHFTVE